MNREESERWAEGERRDRERAAAISREEEIRRRSDAARKGWETRDRNRRTELAATVQAVIDGEVEQCPTCNGTGIVDRRKK